MTNFFKRSVIMLFLCYIGISYGQSINRTVTQSSNARVTESSSQLNLNDSKSDQEQLIKQCLTFQPLLDKVPAEVRAQMNSFYIVNKGAKLSTSLDFEVEGKSVLLLSGSEIGSGKAYFLFNTLNIENDRALIEYDFVFTYKGVIESMSITAEFGRNDSKWKKFNYYIAN